MNESRPPQGTGPANADTNTSNTDSSRSAVEILASLREQMRREHPEARRQVSAMYSERRWYFYWKRHGGEHDRIRLARGLAAVDRAVHDNRGEAA